MKRFLICFIMIFAMMINIIGCSNTQFISFESKPSKSFYSDEVLKIVSTNNYTVKILDMNMYKELTVSDDEKNIVYEFLNHIDKNSNYVSNLDSLTEKDIKYKIFIEGNNQKYVINVYNDKYVCIHPWDGKFTEDFITTDNTPIYYNLYEFCKYLFKSKD